jgi:Bacteriophage replication gene A protein (GPA)
MIHVPSDAAWTQSRVGNLPSRWAERLLGTWAKKHPLDYYSANVELRETTESLLRVRIPLDASDATICEAAASLSDRCAGSAQIFHQIDALRAAMERICAGQGIKAPAAKVKDRPAIARMCCRLWWRRKLRRHQGQTVEAAAIRLGYVSKFGDLYVSNEGLRSRIQQNARNAATLEATIARNEAGQEFTLAELAAKGPANKAVRRAELMTRIAGFERIARELRHAGLFVTITCPSRFHKFRTVNHGKKVIANPNYDSNETPSTGQKYLAKIWTHIRADFKRNAIEVYGFRIAEPQHDGTPHWHLLLFCLKEAASAVQRIIAKHALKDAPDEVGAATHRCDFKTIDWARGSAAAYVAKYVAKNIDGHGVGDDLNQKPACETAARVEAWATRWGVRQFQQVGGPTIGVWRELRRIKKLPNGAPLHLRQAHDAVNKVAVLEGRENASVAWDHYCKAQGGVSCGRDAKIKLAMLKPEKAGRYGDDAALRPFGVETTSLGQYLVAGTSAEMEERTVVWIAESERHFWEIVRRSPTDSSESDFLFAKRPQDAQPWTCVNNCTSAEQINVLRNNLEAEN